MGERVSYSEKKEYGHTSEIYCKGNEVIYLVRCVIGGETWLHNIEDIVAFYLSGINSELIAAG